MFKENRLAFEKPGPSSNPETLTTTTPKTPETETKTPEPISGNRPEKAPVLAEGKAERVPMQTEIIPPLASEVALVGDSIGTGIERALNALDDKRHDKIGKKGMVAVGGVKTFARDVPMNKKTAKEIKLDADSITLQIDRIDPTKFPYLIIQGGTNDIGWQYENPDPRTVARKLADLYHQAAKKQPPFKKIMLVTLPPHQDNKEFNWETRVRICNEELRKIAAAEGINLFDLHTECMERIVTRGDGEKYDLPKDGVHPGRKEYKMIADMLMSGLTGSQYSPEETLKIAEARDKENPSKAVHARYLSTAAEIKEETAKADEELIRKSLITDLRKKSRLLHSKPEKEETASEQITNLKDETARRIRAYTDSRDGEWYTLNYIKFGSDSKGTSHEMNIGLGEILLDNDIQEVLIMKTTGEIVKGHKQIISNGRHKGRTAYTDDNGRYIPTYTGDKFRILSDKETDLKNETEVKTYVEKLAEHDKARDEAEIEIDDSNSVSNNASLPFADESNLDSSKNVSDQILKKLSGEQLENAKIIEREFKAAGITQPNLIAAAIVNAYHESGLRNIRCHNPKEDSAGLFQLNIRGAGKGMSLEERLDPVKNCAGILRVIKGGFGKTLRARAAAGASVQELAYIFCHDIERPLRRIEGSKNRANSSLTFFARKPLEAPDSLIAEYQTIDGLTAHSNLKSGQETWFIGSSSVNGLATANRDPSIGTLGISGASPYTVLRELRTNILPRLGKIKMPKRVVLVGMCVNGLSTRTSVEKTVEENLKVYKQIAEVFEQAGVTVKISAGQLYGPKKAQIVAFNKTLKEHPEYSKYYFDTGIDLPDTQLASDNLHLTTGGYKKILDAEKRLREARV